MKVGLVIDDHMARPGGVQEYVRGLYRYLIQHDHQAVIFSSAGGAPADDLRLVPIGTPLPFTGSGSSTSIPLTLASSRQLRRLLCHEACDVLHVMAPYSPTLSGRLLMQSQALHVLTFHVATEPGLRRMVLGALAKLQYRSLRRVDGRIAVSATAAATGRAFYGGDYHLIPNGVDLAHWASAAAPRLSRGEASVKVLYIGRLEHRKGVRYLIQAFAHLQQQYPALQLIIGGDGPERESLERLVDQLGLEHVQFLGYVSTSDLPGLLSSADIFCAPATQKESFGIVLIEAFAAGLPVVAAANEGYAALLAAHPGNLLVPPANARALAGALATLVEQPEYRRRVGQRNHEAAKQYDWQVVGGEIVVFYEHLLAVRAASPTS
ncbi:MAG: glycosyltransferase family 4 protein [Herpetosiphonaceae bacterium]|nr:glycosyltransferase family 4 protein [Herpetosiphonaceae bacterium]